MGKKYKVKKIYLLQELELCDSEDSESSGLLDILDITNCIEKKQTEAIDASYSEIGNKQKPQFKISKPNKVRDRNRREYNIHGEVMSLYDIAERLIPDSNLSRRKKYRRLGGILERDFRTDDGGFDNVGFTKYLNKEWDRAKAFEDSNK